MLFNRLTAIACFIAIYTAAAAQKDINYKFANVTVKDFDVSNDKIIDSDAAAIILYEAGATHFIGNEKGWFSYVFTCTKKIKIINKRAFDAANIGIGLYSKDDNAEVLSDVKATTYNLNNGSVSSTSLNKNDIFSEQEDKNHILKKFTLPAVQEGSIIEYTYTITSPYTFNMPSWQFQSTNFPVLWSEYKVSIPSALMYVSIHQGFDSFYIKKASQGYESYSVVQPADKSSLGSQEQRLTVNAVTNNYRWVEKDLKALKIESYISSPENYVDKIEFQLSGTYNGEDKHDVANTWQNACKEFVSEEDFQAAVTGDNGWIKDVADFKTGQNSLDIAKNIYYYLQNNYSCTDTLDIFKQTDLYDVYKKQKGSVRGLNLLLTAMLKNKGIYAQPVMLSTRENGFVNPNYPVIDKFNYLICRAIISGNTYLLDATNPVLAFGELPVKCYNGYARVIDQTRPDSLYLLADSLKESEVSTLFLSNDENGKITGSYKCIMGKMESAEMRKQMRTTAVEDYSKQLKKEYPFEVSIGNVIIDSLEQKEMPVAVDYDISFKPEEDIIYFSPMLSGNVQSENPFKAAQRSYPVEMPYCTDKTYILNMQVPAGYKVDELPKSARVSLNDNEGSFEYLIQQSGDNIQLRCRTKINKTNFEPDDYETLRNFFAFIVEKEGEQIVFKKN
jgi:hypothetical protein